MSARVYNNQTAFKPQLMAGLLVAFCAMGAAESAVASCGDYLYKRGSKNSDAMPMESHSDDRCENQRHDPLPVVPPPVPERENDELGSHSLLMSAQVDDSDWGRHDGSATALAGFQSRIDRPPQS